MWRRTQGRSKYSETTQARPLFLLLLDYPLIPLKECCLDVEWLDTNTFASCSMDKLIHLCQVGKSSPLVTFVGHTNEVNQIRFSDDKTLLASCSDDMTARVWNVKGWGEMNGPGSSSQGREEECTWVLRGHTGEIGAITWCPPIEGQTIVSTYVLRPFTPLWRCLLTLFTCRASFDSTARLWDAHTGTCLRVISKHSHRVYTHAFSPDGKYFATGGGDGRMFVHRTLVCIHPCLPESPIEAAVLRMGSSPGSTMQMGVCSRFSGVRTARSSLSVRRIRRLRF
jgi:hypothetical protein